MVALTAISGNWRLFKSCEQLVDADKGLKILYITAKISALALKKPYGGLLKP